MNSGKFKRLGLSALGLLTGAALLTPLAAGAAGATVVDPGSIEICKAPLPTAIGANPTAVNQTTFSFTITPGLNGKSVSASVTTEAGLTVCTAPISVNAGAQTVSETSGAWFTAASIVAAPAVATTTSLSTNSAIVPVSSDLNETVTYTNKLVTGSLEVCKATSTGSTLTGDYPFTITGADGFKTSTSVTVGDCSSAILVPAGTVTVAEGGTNLYVTGITATYDVNQSAIAAAPNLTTGTVGVKIIGATDNSQESIVTYTNQTVNLKVCKVWGNGVEPGGATTLFPFSEVVSSTAVAGPDTAPAPWSMAAGTAAAPVCAAPVAYRPGTTVTINEGIVPGTKVQAINTSGALSVVPNTLTLQTTATASGSIQVIVGNAVTTTSPLTNEGVVTFTDEAADPGQLKACLAAGTPAPLVPVTFTVANALTPTVVEASVTVSEANECALFPGTFPFNSHQIVTQVAQTVGGLSNSTTPPIVTAPAFVYENGVATTEPSLASSTTGAAASAVVVPGEDDTTNVTFTTIDPPVITTSTPAPVVSTGTGVAVVTPTSTSTSSSVSTSSSISGTSISTSTPTFTIPATVPVVVKPLTAAQKKAELKSYNKTLSNVKSAIVRENKLIAHASGKARTADIKRLRTLQSEVKTLNAKIRALK